MTLADFRDELDVLIASAGEEAEIRIVDSDGAVLDVDMLEVDANDDTVINIIAL